MYSTMYSQVVCLVVRSASLDFGKPLPSKNRLMSADCKTNITVSYWARIRFLVCYVMLH